MPDEHSFREKLWALRRYLDAQEGSELADTQTLIALLVPVWDQLEDAKAYAMSADKLDRLESPSWSPPLLTFTIERHGGTVQGSSRAEMQQWAIDLDTLTAEAASASYRQLTPARKRLDIASIASRIAAAIAEEADEPWLEWSRDRSEVRVLSSHFINPDSAPRETLDGRRKRLRSTLRDELEKIGWVPMSQPGRYRRAGA
jgi:hypothetical protein